ncbi:hypothetical protein F4679DRAFT_597832 [Xylaria curta]|nr:hypothetical protein F4679DRAFT_597832 [Xylaria curta]
MNSKKKAAAGQKKAAVKPAPKPAPKPAAKVPPKATPKPAAKAPPKAPPKAIPKATLKPLAKPKTTLQKPPSVANSQRAGFIAFCVLFASKFGSNKLDTPSKTKTLADTIRSMHNLTPASSPSALSKGSEKLSKTALADKLFPDGKSSPYDLNAAIQKQILAARTAKEAQELRNTYQLSDGGSRWAAIAEADAMVITVAKFLQNPELLMLLMSTGQRALVYTSPKDKNWGIGAFGERFKNTIAECRDSRVMVLQAALLIQDKRAAEEEAALEAELIDELKNMDEEEDEQGEEQQQDEENEEEEDQEEEEEQDDDELMLELTAFG